MRVVCFSVWLCTVWQVDDVDGMRGEEMAPAPLLLASLSGCPSGQVFIYLHHSLSCHLWPLGDPGGVSGTDVACGCSFRLLCRLLWRVILRYWRPLPCSTFA